MSYRAVIVVPIYNNVLNPVEDITLQFSFKNLELHDICFIAPKRLDTSYYRLLFPKVRFMFFDDHFFASPQTYSNLLLDQNFYKAYSNYSHMLIMQTDAVVLSDNLESWMKTNYDYIGAPWPTKYMITLPKMNNGFSELLFVLDVGNGGLSLRKISSCINVLEEVSWVLRYQPMDEDLFFALAARMSYNFHVPNTIRAALFSLEREPRLFYRITNKIPMGCHAWAKWDKNFWINIFEKCNLTNLGIG